MFAQVKNVDNALFDRYKKLLKKHEGTKLEFKNKEIFEDALRKEIRRLEAKYEPDKS